MDSRRRLRTEEPPNVQGGFNATFVGMSSFSVEMSQIHSQRQQLVASGDLGEEEPAAAAAAGSSSSAVVTAPVALVDEEDGVGRHSSDPDGSEKDHGDKEVTFRSGGASFAEEDLETRLPLIEGPPGAPLHYRVGGSGVVSSKGWRKQQTRHHQEPEQSMVMEPLGRHQQPVVEGDHAATAADAARVVGATTVQGRGVQAGSRNWQDCSTSTTSTASDPDDGGITVYGHRGVSSSWPPVSAGNGALYRYGSHEEAVAAATAAAVAGLQGGQQQQQQFYSGGGGCGDDYDDDYYGEMEAGSPSDALLDNDDLEAGGGGGGGGGKRSTGKKGYPREIRKTIFAGLFLCTSFLMTTASLAVVHEKTPTGDPPLPDIILDNITFQPWALTASEVILQIQVGLAVTLVVFHRHRLIVFRRIALVLGLLYGYRAITMFVTNLPKADPNYFCKPQMGNGNLTVTEVGSRVLQILTGFGLSMNGHHVYCGDYIFSGHTMTMILSHLILQEYTSRRLWLFHWLTVLSTICGISFLVLGRGHYTIDIIIAYWITTRLWIYYHGMTSHEKLKSPSGLNYFTRLWWWPIFRWFECNVRSGPLPNGFDLPLPSFALNHFKSWRRQKPRWRHRLSAMDEKAQAALANIKSVVAATSTSSSSNGGPGAGVVNGGRGSIRRHGGPAPSAALAPSSTKVRKNSSTGRTSSATSATATLKNFITSRDSAASQQHGGAAQVHFHHGREVP